MRLGEPEDILFSFKFEFGAILRLSEGPGSSHWGLSAALVTVKHISTIRMVILGV